VGHRALVAVEGSDSRYALYRSQWGAQSLVAASRGDDSGSSSLVGIVADAVVDGRRIARDCAVRAVLDALDPYSDEALLVARRAGTVEPFIVVPLGLVLRNGTVGGDRAAALVPVRDRASARRLLAAVASTRASLGAAVDAGALSASAALSALRASVACHPDAPPETLWLPLP